MYNVFELFWGVFLLVIVFTIGACFGSFLNAIIYRLHEGMPITTRSICPQCKRKLHVADLIPIVSFLLLKGKCRYCSTRIPLRYLLVEMLLGFIFVLASVFIGTRNLWLTLIYLAIVFFLVGIMVSDFVYFEIPNIFIYMLIFLAFFYRFLLDFMKYGVNLWTQTDYYNITLGLVFPLIFFGVQYFLTNKQGLGEGDIWLGVAIGILLGYPVVVDIVLSTYVISSIALLLLVTFKVIKFNSIIPLGSLLSAFTIIYFTYELVKGDSLFILFKIVLGGYL